ncbi:KAP family NTPase [Acinetobacter haemolyticus]|uniref:KAP family P-loop NTPase fold protein n=1 Tax=unclassified Acinetobacter TaxID=196816 RepID=UPI0015D332ED|nr:MULTISPECIES: P-loop NTPase fold protein [unclassified Acinetobacter]UDM39029.1 KAP family NTPase [Acinetobacter haemolyticus]
MHEKDQLNWQRDNFENINEAWEGDLWDRKRLGEQLTNYVDRLQCGAVLALDARWGEGKTWFVRHWAKHLSDTDHNVIYLDAFANDYLDDPFLVISSEITSCLSKDCDLDQKHIDAFKGKAAAAYHALLPSLPKVLLTLGLNLISGGVLGTAVQEAYKVGEKAVESATDEIGDKIKESIDEKIEAHEADKNTLLAFKQQLSQLAEDLDKPLVFVIDELDRCRPDFSIRLIERIKHFFDIPKIVFILVMNKPQLLQSVKSYYGYDSKLNGDYFEKFIDFTVHLSSGKCEKNYENIIKEQLFRIGELTNKDEVNEFYFWVLALQLEKKLNPRELVKKLNQYALLRTSENNKNLILISLMMTPLSVKHDYIRYFETIIKILSNNLYLNKRDFMKKHNLNLSFNTKFDAITDTTWVRDILKWDYKIEDFFMGSFIHEHHNIERIRDDASWKESKYIEYLSAFSISPLSKTSDFIESWMNYIKTGL